MGKPAIAGMLHHHKGLAALLNPTTNSYRRSKPGALAAYWANWGYDHRAATVRVSPDHGASARIEHRMADSTANPYVILAALLQAARLGQEHNYDLPEPETNDGIEVVCTDIHMGNSLEEALNDLESDTRLTQAIGQGLIDNFMEIKRAEITKVKDCLDSEFVYYSPFI